MAGNPAQSHAVFRLAQLESEPRAALALYERYVRLEPTDPWGLMALGDAFARMDRFQEALTVYDSAARLAPDERDVAVGRARVFASSGNSEAAADPLHDWLIGHPGDAEAWDQLGRNALRMGRPRAAAAAFEHARSLGYGHAVEQRQALARARAAPAVEPTTGYQGDSDENTTSRYGVLADVAVADGTRFGVLAARTTTSDGFTTVSGLDLGVHLAARPHSGVTLQAQGGVTSYDAVLGSRSWRTFVGDARFRARAPRNGPVLELRAQRVALGTSPLLIANEAVRDEARATVEMPLAALRLRGTGRLGEVTALDESANARYGADASIALPLGEHLAFSAQYHRLGYARGSNAGYFAPKLVETREAGLYMEAGEDGITVAADLGAGVQRLTDQQTLLPSAWTHALRGWSYVNVPLGPGRGLWLELEGYDAPFSDVATATSASWRFLSLSAGLRLTLP